ncbi:PEP-CTERM sorting domain-containing protein [Thiobacillus sp.]|uniref:PEP-CTERM sorting domain-containing protein n=1 Tax=Thiobacillus sp. TaxID=924 RepID=UPI0025E78190|nr:PEP-CTERM sorting domain-containing protein [Thiobacillus sp.]MBT9539838.1 PEP-CTERM sorting domain-containing protein [Thiobacillus sp.]
MNFTMTKIAAAAVLALAASGAQAVTVTSASVTGGNFEMIGFGAPITFAAFGTGAADILGYDGTTPGSAVANTAFSADGIVGFGFGAGIPGSTQKTVNTYTAAANLGDVNSAAGTISGFAPVTFNIASMTNGASITADTSAWFANYNGTDFNQGSGRNLVDGAADGSFATGTLSGCSGNSCSYTLNWSSYIVGGSFDGNTGVWNLSGTVTAAVPEASTYGMMLAGLGLVGGMVARRRKLVA